MKKILAPLAVSLLLSVGCGEDSYKPEENIISQSVNHITFDDITTEEQVDTSSDDDSSKENSSIEEQPEDVLETQPEEVVTPEEVTEDYNWASPACEEAKAQCGSIRVDFDTTIECGTCPLHVPCVKHRCVSPCDPNPCQGPENICRPTAAGYFCSCEPGYELSATTGSCEKLESVTLRLMAANTTSTTKQSYAGPGIRMFMGLKPDIVMIQEFKYIAKVDDTFKFKNMDEFIAATFGPEYSYHVGTGDLPNGIISKYPILESGSWIDNNAGNRNFEYARIDIPGDKDLWAISVHLLTSTTKQPNEAADLVKYITANVPEGDYIVVGGDFNTDKRSAGALTKLNKVVATKLGGYPKDHKGNANTNAARKYPYDGVYVNKELNSMETPIVYGSYHYINGLVFDSRIFTPLNKVSPVLKSDSGSPNMQHMPVIRDFKLW